MKKKTKSKDPEDLQVSADGKTLTSLVLKVKELSWGIIRNYMPCFEGGRDSVVSKERCLLTEEEEKKSPDFQYILGI